MKTIDGSLLILPLAFGLGVPSAEAVQYVAQERYLFGRVGSAFDLTSEQHDAPDFGPFSDALHLDYAFLSGTAHADIAHSSTLSASMIFASATTTARGSGSNPSTSAIARTLLNVHFVVSDPTDFQLDGSLDWTASGTFLPPVPPDIWVRLNGPTGTVFNIQRSASIVGSLSFSGPDAITGTLTTGGYTLEAWISAGGGDGSSAQGSFNFTLAVPSPGTDVVLGAASLALVHRRRRAPR